MEPTLTAGRPTSPAEPSSPPVDGALGTTASGTTVAANAALALSGGVAYGTPEPLTISGPGITTASAPFAAVQRGAIQAVSGANSSSGPIVFTSAANTRIGVQDGASLTLNGSITEQTAGSAVAFRHGNTAGSDIVLTGTGNSWTGNTDIYGGAGAVVLGVDNALSLPAVLRLGTSGIPGSSTLDLHGFDQTVTGLTQVVSNSPATITNQAAATASTLTVDSSADTVYPAAISDSTGTVALTKKGTGTLTLSGSSSTYSGGTVIDGGRLLANNSTGSATGFGDITVNSGGTLGGTGAVSSGGHHVRQLPFPGASIESLTVGSVTGSGTLVIEYDGLAATPTDFLSVQTTLNLSGMSLDAQMTGSPLVAPSYIFRRLRHARRRLRHHHRSLRLYHRLPLWRPQSDRLCPGSAGGSRLCRAFPATFLLRRRRSQAPISSRHSAA